jgi:hypothetical protein
MFKSETGDCYRPKRISATLPPPHDFAPIIAIAKIGADRSGAFFSL